MANLNNNSLTDPWGFTDSWTGQITYIRGTNLADTFIANGLGDTFSGVGGNDSFTGGAGFDFVDYRFDVTNGGSGAVNVDLAAGTATDGFGATDTFTSIEGVYGTNGGGYFYEVVTHPLHPLAPTPTCSTARLATTRIAGN